MKMIIFLTLTMVLFLTFGSAYANEAVISGELYNGITDFTGRTLDAPSGIGSVDSVMVVGSPGAGSGAGGPSPGDADRELYNGITDFTGVTLDAPWGINAGGSTASGLSEESSGAGGLSTGDVDSGLFNGITDFTGRTPDAPSDTGM
jgi:hypothetical protein